MKIKKTLFYLITLYILVIFLIGFPLQIKAGYNFFKYQQPKGVYSLIDYIFWSLMPFVYLTGLFGLYLSIVKKNIKGVYLTILSLVVISLGASAVSILSENINEQYDDLLVIFLLVLAFYLLFKRIYQTNSKN